MKRSLFLFLIFAGSIHGAAQQQEEKITNQQIEQLAPFVTNGVFIFLGPQAEDPFFMDVVGYNALYALHQKAGPILISSTILKNIIKHPSAQQYAQLWAKIRHFNELDAYQAVANMRTAIDNYLNALPSNIPHDQKEKILTQVNAWKNEVQNKFGPIKFSAEFLMSLFKDTLTINFNEWIIKKVNEHLLLLIPIEYIDKISKKNSRERFFNSQNYTARELNLGMKIDHLETINDIFTFVQTYKQPSESDPGAFFLEYLPSIFLSTAEYKAQSRTKFALEQAPTWSIFLLGHGQTDQSIANISLPEFRKLLTFFEHSIITKLFIYNSCYSAGFNAQQVYKNVESSFLKTYPFTIVTGALTDAPTRAARPTVFFKITLDHIDFVHKKLRTIQLFRFDEFLKEITENNIIRFDEIFYLLFPETFLLTDPSSVFSFPQIKLPGIPWFSIIDADKQFISIGTILASTRTAPLNIMSFFTRQKEPIAILLYANLFNFELIIPTKQVPILIPMTTNNPIVSNKSIYKFKKIKISVSIDNFFKTLVSLKDFGLPVLFVIDQLETIANEGNSVLFKAVYLYFNEGKLEFYVTDPDNNKIQWDIKKSQFIAAPFYDKVMQQLFAAKVQMENPFEGWQAAEKSREQLLNVQQKKIREAQEKKAKIAPQLAQYPFIGSIIEAWALALNSKERNVVIKQLQKLIQEASKDVQIHMNLDLSKAEKMNDLITYKNIANSAHLFLEHHYDQYDPQLGFLVEENIKALKQIIDDVEKKLLAEKS